MPDLPHNQRAIDSLGSVDGQRTYYTSKVVSGLSLEVMPSGARTWRFRYRTSGGRNGRTLKFTIGDAASIKLGKAIDAARDIKARIQVEGADPQRQRKFTAGRFDALFDKWLERHAKLKKKSWNYDEALYRRHVHQRLGRLMAAEIKRSDIAAALDDIVRSATGIQANRAQTLISSVFNWAVNEGLLEHSPMYRLPKRANETPRERVLTPVELCILWQGLGQGPLGLAIARIIRLALLTGQRRAEIAEASKDEFDLSDLDPSWTIPGARTKNSVLHRVPLTPAAVALLSAAKDESRSQFMFPSRDTPKNPISRHAVSRAMARLTARLGIEDATVHDLRRTVGTGLARLGVTKDIRARILNHVDGARSVTDAVYNQHEFRAEKRAALELWEAELLQIVALSSKC
jgi:integrase